MRRLLLDPPPPGAAPCVGLVDLEAILTEAEGLDLTTGQAETWPGEGRLFVRLLGPAFATLPASVREVHGQGGQWKGQARARGASGLAAMARLIAGLRPGRFEDFQVSIDPARGGETWRRQFGASAFQSNLRAVPGEIGVFEEALGPLRFALRARARGPGFDWVPIGWRIGAVPLPRVLMPRIAARSFDRDGVYRFRVRISHPLCGLIIAYAGSLRTAPDVAAP